MTSEKVGKFLLVGGAHDGQWYEGERQDVVKKIVINPDFHCLRLGDVGLVSVLEHDEYTLRVIRAGDDIIELYGHYKLTDADVQRRLIKMYRPNIVEQFERQRSALQNARNILHDRGYLYADRIDEQFPEIALDAARRLAARANRESGK